MFSIGGFELFIILLFAFLIFGPEKLPEIGRTVGRAIAKFRDAQQEMNETLGNDKIFDPNNPDEPFKDPIEALDKLAARQEEKRKDKQAAPSGATTATAPAASSAKPADEGQTTDADPSAGTETTGDAAEPRKESFTERKARYERERAARKAAESAAATDAANTSTGDQAKTPSAPADSEGGDA